MHILDRTFDQLLGLPCWKVDCERFLGLQISFGTPVMIIDEPRQGDGASPRIRRSLAHRRVTVRGRWWMWILCGRWSLTLRDSDVRTTLSSPLRKRTAALRFLDGQKLTRATIDRGTGETVLGFDLGAVLRIRGSSARDGEMYLLYKPSGYVLAVHKGGRFSHERASSPSRWRKA